jgi:non-homologous end joining protein Ku
MRGAERIAFRQINKATGNRLRQQLIDEETREYIALAGRLKWFCCRHFGCR